MKITKERNIIINQIKYTEFLIRIGNDQELVLHIDDEGLAPKGVKPMHYILEELGKVRADTALAPVIMIKLVAEFNL